MINNLNKFNIMKYEMHTKDQCWWINVNLSSFVWLEQVLSSTYKVYFSLDVILQCLAPNSSHLIPSMHFANRLRRYPFPHHTGSKFHISLELPLYVNKYICDIKIYLIGKMLFYQLILLPITYPKLFIIIIEWKYFKTIIPVTIDKRHWYYWSITWYFLKPGSLVSIKIISSRQIYICGRPKYSEW